MNKDMDSRNIPGRFLLVEDEPINQLIIKAMVSDLGYEVDIASNAKMAMEFLNQSSYALIFIDLGLPDKPGLQIIQEIRTHLYLDTPIVVLTAHGAVFRKEACLDAGCDIFVEKPMTQQKLEAILSELIFSAVP